MVELRDFKEDLEYKAFNNHLVRSSATYEVLGEVDSEVSTYMSKLVETYEFDEENKADKAIDELKKDRNFSKVEKKAKSFKDKELDEICIKYIVIVTFTYDPNKD